MHLLVRYPFFHPTHRFAPFFTIASLNRPIGYRSASWGVLISFIFATTVAQAASRTDADQELLRQQARERVLRQQQEPTPDVRLDRPLVQSDQGRLPLNESPCFKIERILLKGEAATQFQWALASADHGPADIEDAPIGRCLGSGGIDRIMRRVQNAIIAKG